MTVSIGNGKRLHLVRYGTSAEQKYLSDAFAQTYDVMVVNANMVSHTSAALAAFIGETLLNKPFIIDPLTHAFQHDVSLLERESSNDDAEVTPIPRKEPNLRRSIRKLMQAYGDPVESKMLAGEVVLPEDFGRDEAIRTFAHRVGNFQLQELSHHAQERGLSDYYQFIGVHNPVTPTGVVAPYFYMELRTYDQWLDVNTALAEATVEHFGKEHDVFAELVISKDILYDDWACRRIVDRFSSIPVRAVLLWIDDFSEHAAPLQLLRRYITFVRQLGQHHPVVSLYGSYFSTCLMRLIPNSGLAGVCHGLEYGEDRAVIPAVGGLPVSKFYYPELHKRVRFTDAFKMARPYLESASTYLRQVCNCDVCTKLVSNSVGGALEDAFYLYGKSHPVTFRRKYQVVTLEYPDTDTRDRCVQHYLWNKHKEFTDPKAELESVVEQLRRSFDRHKRVLGLTDVGHCSTWATALETLTLP